MDRNQIVKSIKDFFNNLGINPIYVFTAILLIFNVKAIKKMKHWNEIPFNDKVYDIIGLLITVILILLSFILMIGSVVARK
jgi:uncharacterized BrkB/YihY/UPF0761 family membrane protein